jgi:hypothetical protein
VIRAYVQRAALAAALNALLVAPTFASWREGTDLDVGAWLASSGPRTPAVIFSVAHLEDEQRALVLGLLLDEVLGWVRNLPGTQRLRALVVIDEVFGLLPPHPANPPTKGPIVSLMKQARAYGVGIVLATQNPMDLDYRALSNAGLWCIGRLQTDADPRARHRGPRPERRRGGLTEAARRHHQEAQQALVRAARRARRAGAPAVSAALGSFLHARADDARRGEAGAGGAEGEGGGEA